MPEIRTTHYEDGRWCEQEYVVGKLHGRWTVFFANGQKEWERQHAKGRKEGYFRRWDETGRLTEEEWYHLDVMHGPWRTWDQTGREKLVGEFYYGYPRQALDATVNPDFNTLIKPYYGLESVEFETIIENLLPTLRRKTLRMRKTKSRKLDLTQPGSFWNHVNVLGVGERWPRHNSQPLCPILQINCADIALSDHPLTGLAFVTLFSASGEVLAVLGEDLVIRAYRQGEKIKVVEAPCDPLEPPTRLSLAEELVSYPDENDLPPGLKVFLEEAGDPENVLNQEEKLSSRLGGWPGWIQSGRVSSFGRFAFQVDSLDVENWDCGDCTIHYFFLNGKSEFSWCQEMC